MKLTEVLKLYKVCSR